MNLAKLFGGHLPLLALFARLATAKILSAIGGNASQASKLHGENRAFPNQDSVLIGGAIPKNPMQF
jgi:hypothetical protein